MQTSPELVGYDWLRATTGVDPVVPLRVCSRLDTARSSARTAVTIGDRTEQHFPAVYMPAATVRAQLTFAFKYEGVHLEFLTALFTKLGPNFIVDWLADEPGSQYARRTGFFYEWLTGKQVPAHEAANGNYVDAIDSKAFLAAVPGQSTQNRRWRVNDNMPGTPAFCPMIRLDRGVLGAASIDFAEQIASLVQDFGEERILRSVNWLTVKESRASFAIERERTHEDRIHRFARAMDRFCGRIEDPLSEFSLRKLQETIIDSKASTFSTGLRRSPVFVGHSDRFEQVIDYVAPHFDHVPGMLEGLQAYSNRTRGQNPVLRATALSFGFVYIHPMADGNGRISRFLINDTLRRDGAVPAPLILPISAIISSSLYERAQYDHALESISRPLMDRFQGATALSPGEPTVYEDGVKSNFAFSAWEQAAPVWRYLDLSSHAAYLGRVIDHSIVHGIRDEAAYLARFDQARSNLKNILDGRDEDFDRIIRSINETKAVSGKLRKLYPTAFAAPEAAQAITSAVLDAFEDKPKPQLVDDESPEPDTFVRLRCR